jgi:hypothetical protein
VFEETVANFAGQKSISITERLDEYRLFFESANTTPQEALAQTLQLLKLAEKIPSRDSFELQVDFEGDVLTLTDTSKSAWESVSTHLGAHDDQGEIRYELTVKKGANGALSLYCMTAFGRYVEHEDLATVLVALDSRFDNGISFECLCPVSACGSNTIRFWPHGQIPQIAEEPQRLQVLTSFRENSYSAGLKTDFLPSDFYLLQRTNVPAINNFMDKACAVLCAMYLANSSQIHSPGRLSYKLVGYKSVESEAAFSEFAQARDGLYKIYDWAYGVGGSADRIGLARNVVSLHVDRLQDLSDHSSLWNAIYSNYQIYLKANIASYLEVKNRITEFLVESTSKAHALVEDLVDSLKNSIFVILTFLLTVVVVNGLKDTGLTVIFSASYFWIVALLCMALTVWVGGTCFGAIRRFDNSTQTTAEILQLGYGRILLSSEINENINPINARNRTYLIRQCWRYLLYWLLIAAILVGGFGLGYKYLGATQTVPATAAEENAHRADTDAKEQAPALPKSKPSASAPLLNLDSKPQTTAPTSPTQAPATKP